MIKAGIVGSGGYAAGELIRLLLAHPEVQLVWAQSQSQAGKPIYTTHEDLIGDTDLCFSAEAPLDQVDVVFLCGGHGQSTQWMAQHQPSAGQVIIDLSQDFRLDSGFVYGLPEANRAQITSSKRIANPGCFATAIQLGLLPLAAKATLTDEVHIQATTGSTGAGQALQDTLHFSWRQNNLSVYKPFGHQHLAEIRHTLAAIQAAPALPELLFVPLRGGFTRGILATLYTRTQLSEEALYHLYQAYYHHSPFTVITHSNPNLKQVVNTNKALIYLEKHADRVLIISMIDNLLKGAAGQAIENMNLAFGLPQDSGLRIKASVF